MVRKRKISFKEFYLKAGIEDVMAAGLYYRQFLHSGLTLEEWLGKKPKTPNKKTKK